MQLRRISSLLTVFYKFILPGWFGLGLLNTIMWGGHYFTPDPDFPVVYVYAIVIFFIGFSLLIGWNLNWVAIDDANQRLYVSNYRREIAVPFFEIDKVTQFYLSDPARITIHLKHESEFGKKIVFLATYRFGGILAGTHPMVAELRNRPATAELSR
jgi:hypothetical protein